MSPGRMIETRPYGISITMESSLRTLAWAVAIAAGAGLAAADVRASAEADSAAGGFQMRTRAARASSLPSRPASEDAAKRTPEGAVVKALAWTVCQRVPWAVA
jgi:hypothetical protein